MTNDAGPRTPRPGHRDAKGGAGAGKAPILAAGVALALCASAAVLLLRAREEPTPPAAEASPAPAAAPPQRTRVAVQRLRSGAAAPARPEGPQAGPGRAAGGGPRAEAPAPARGGPDEEEVVIENEPGRDYGPGVDARDYIAALRAAGETEGIAAFDPPGTDPPKAGLIVPDDYVLPEGYARHYQSSDDGRPLAPILVFSPDYEFLDEQGRPIPIPEDGVVPPELAPPDLPIEWLDPEAPAEPGGLIAPSP